MLPASTLVTIQRTLAAMCNTHTLMLWRTTGNGPKVGPPAKVGSCLASVDPVSTANPMVLAQLGLAGGRASHVGYLGVDLTIRDDDGQVVATQILDGDEVRTGAQRFKVEGVTHWSTLIVLALSELR